MAVLKTFYSACNAVKVNLKVGFICPFVVIDSTNLRATIVVAQAVSLTIRVERKRLKNDERQRLRKCVGVWEGAGERQNEIHYRDRLRRRKAERDDFGWTYSYTHVCV